METETETGTEQSGASLQISLPEKPRELQLWLIDELTILAEALGESVTKERLRIYAKDLTTDLSREQLQTAVVRSRRELKFFPKISELRELAGADPEGMRNVEAQAAWVWVNEYLRTWGVDRMPVYQGGRRIEAPPIPTRIDYALRRVGGLQALNQVTFDSRPFMQKDFIEAYNQAPLAELLAPQLADTFGATKLLGSARQLTGGHPRDKEQLCQRVRLRIVNSNRRRSPLH